MYMSEELFDPEYFEKEDPTPVISEPIFASSGPFPSSPPNKKARVEVKEVESESEDDGVGEISFEDDRVSLEKWKKNFIKRIMDSKRKPEEIDGMEKKYVEELFAQNDNDPGTVLHKLYENGILNPGAQNKHQANDWSRESARKVVEEFYLKYIDKNTEIKHDEKKVLRAALVDGAPSIICFNEGKYTDYAICLTHIEAGESDGEVEKLLIKAFTHGLLTPGGSARQFERRVMYRHLRDIMKDPSKQEEINEALKSIIGVWEFNMKNPGQINEHVETAVKDGICYRGLFYKNKEELISSPAGKEKRIGYRPREHPTLIARHPGNTLKEILKNETDKKEIKRILEQFSGPLSVEPSPFVDDKAFMDKEKSKLPSNFYIKKGEIVRKGWYDYENIIRKGKITVEPEEETEAKNIMINIFINALGLNSEEYYHTIEFFLNDNDWNLDNTLKAYLNTTPGRIRTSLRPFNASVELRSAELAASEAAMAVEQASSIAEEKDKKVSEAAVVAERSKKMVEELIKQEKMDFENLKRAQELAASAREEVKKRVLSATKADERRDNARGVLSDIELDGGGKKNTRRKNTRRKNTRRKNTRRKNTRRKNTRRKNTRRKNTRRKNTRRKR